MTKSDLIKRIATKGEMTTKEAGVALDTVIGSISDALAEGEKVQLVGFGSFEVRERAARTGRNPRNPEETIEIPACKAPAFKAGKELKTRVNA